MTNKIQKIRQFLLDVVQVRPESTFSRKTIAAIDLCKAFTHGISFKLSLLITFLVCVTAGGISLVVISTMDNVQLQSMVRRGAAISNAAAAPAGYSILAEDRLALDNLTARISQSQPDLDYLAIIDNTGQILAHNSLALTGSVFQKSPGVPIGNELGLNVRKVSRDNNWIYEFTVPILFSGNQVGHVITGLNASMFAAARSTAANRIIMIISLLLPLAIAVSLLLSRLFTYPIEQLSDGVARIQSGEDQVIVPITSNDELATLTRNFNKMAGTIEAQKRSLINYSEDLEQSYADIVKILAAALDARDNYTYGHSSRVSQLSVAVGKKLQLKPYELNELEMTCLLHDIGKINIPDSILNKPGQLDDDEYQQIKDHPYRGVEILDLTESLKKYIPAVLHHHEWYDGSGYPENLAGDDIPLYARVLSIADAYDAMTSSRPYRQGMSRHDAIAELKSFKGRQFHPEMVDLFIDALDEYDDVCDMPLSGRCL